MCCRYNTRIDGWVWTFDRHTNMPDSIHCRDPGTAGGVSEMERQGLPALCDYCEVGMDTCDLH